MSGLFRAKMKLVIFDLDGTLLNTLDDLAQAANAALRACGFAERSVDEVRQFVGNGVTKLLERALPEGQKNPENLARLKQAFFDYYNLHLWDQTRPYPGIESLLETLQVRGIKLAIASNKYQRAVEELVAHFFPHISFAAVWGQREDIPTKPDPRMVHEILRACDVSAADTLYVGDSAIDMQTAQNAGVRACGVTWGFRLREELSAFHPVLLADAPHQIFDFLD